jgi:F-type H+-transporting ATPase subunit delta
MQTNTILAELSGSSRQSLAQAQSHLNNVLQGLTSAECTRVSAELFAFVTALDSTSALRRFLTDSARPSSEKSALVDKLLMGGAHSVTVKILHAAVNSRWSSASDISDAIEILAIESEAQSAHVNNELEKLESELFQVAQILVEHPDLSQELASTNYTHEAKLNLVNRVFKEKVSNSTMHLVERLAVGSRGRKMEAIIRHYISAVVARRERTIAHIKTAVGISEEQKKRLAQLLSKMIGQEVRLNIEIDNKVLGGISIRFADELIDATIVSRLADAGRALAV